MYGYFDYDEPVFRPPSEADSLIVQLTLGCSHNRCHFCPMYKGKNFRVRPVSDIAQELAQIPAVHRRSIRRVFIADGDALTAPFDRLTDLFDLLHTALPHLARIGIYASPQSLRLRSPDELNWLRRHKLRLLYFGLESGDDQTLAMVQKGANAQEMLQLCNKAQSAGLKLSVTAILGLGGTRYSNDHARQTAAWVTHLSPTYFSLLTLIPSAELTALPDYRPLTNGQLLEELALMLDNLKPPRTILRSNHASNLLPLAGTLPKDQDRLLAEVHATLNQARTDQHWFNAVPADRSL